MPAISASDSPAEAPDELALGDDEEEHHRDERDHDRREDEVPLGGVLTDEAVDLDRQRLAVASAQKDQRDEEVVPDEEAGEDRDGGRHRTQQREDDLDEGAQRARAVDPGGLLVIRWQRADESRVEEHADRRRDADPEQDHSEVAADEAEVPERDVQRHDPELERNDDPEDEQEVERRAER